MIAEGTCVTEGFVSLAVLVSAIPTSNYTHLKSFFYFFLKKSEKIGRYQGKWLRIAMLISSRQMVLQMVLWRSSRTTCQIQFSSIRVRILIEYKTCQMLTSAIRREQEVEGHNDWHRRVGDHDGIPCPEGEKSCQGEVGVLRWSRICKMLILSCMR